MKKIKTLKVSIVMGSQSDYKTMQFTEKTLKKLGILFETITNEICKKKT